MHRFESDSLSDILINIGLDASAYVSEKTDGYADPSLHFFAQIT